MPPRKKTLEDFQKEIEKDKIGTTPQPAEPMTESEPEHSEQSSRNPLLEPLVERDYTKPNFKVIGGQMPDSVDVPRMERQTIDLREGVNNAEGSNSNIKGNDQPQESNYGKVENPAFSEMKPKAQKESARKMAKTIVEGYANLNNILRDNVVKTNVEKLQLKAIKGEFDMDALNVELPLSETDVITVNEVIQGTNASADEIFTCSDEFNEETEELWTEVLKEKGLGMSPTQRLTWIYVEDLGKKAIAAWGIWKTNKEILSTAMGILAQMKAPTQPVNTKYEAPAPPSAPEPTKQEMPKPEPKPKSDEAEIVND